MEVGFLVWYPVALTQHRVGLPLILVSSVTVWKFERVTTKMFYVFWQCPALFFLEGRCLKHDSAAGWFQGRKKTSKTSISSVRSYFILRQASRCPKKIVKYFRHPNERGFRLCLRQHRRGTDKEQRGGHVYRKTTTITVCHVSFSGTQTSEGIERSPLKSTSCQSLMALT